MKYLGQLKFFLVLLVFGLLSGCSSKPPMLSVNLQAANYLNPNMYKHSSPVVVTIYQLKSPTTFQQANFYALNNNPVSILGGDLLDKQEIELRPNQTQKLKIPLSPETSYIGLIASFRNPDQAQWRRLVKVEPGSDAKLKVSLATQKIIASIK